MAFLFLCIFVVRTEDDGLLWCVCVYVMLYISIFTCVIVGSDHNRVCVSLCVLLYGRVDWCGGVE